MKAIRKHIFAFLLAGAMPALASAADCELTITTLPVEQPNPIPEAVNDMLMTRLSSVLSRTGVETGYGFSQFFITGKFNDYYSDVVPGPPKSFALHTQLTLYVGDILNQSTYATCGFELRGVGTSDQRAFINAMSGINANNPKLEKFIDDAKVKIIDYYDKNYPNILAKARQASAMRNYEEALMYSTSIPECSKGYAEATEATLSIYQAYIDYEGRMLLTAAQGAWAADPDRKGAVAAYGYLRQIDPNASCFAEAQKLMNEIKTVVKENWDFDHKQKYLDEINLKLQMINAAREVGVAYGSHQQPQTTNLMWLK